MKELPIIQKTYDLIKWSAKMKRYGHLFDQITDFNNLFMSAKKAQRGKRFREKVLEFNYHFEEELFKLKAELESQSYRPGTYKTFEIKEPKTRLISGFVKKFGSGMPILESKALALDCCFFLTSKAKALDSKRLENLWFSTVLFVVFH